MDGSGKDIMTSANHVFCISKNRTATIEKTPIIGRMRKLNSGWTITYDDIYNPAARRIKILNWLNALKDKEDKLMENDDDGYKMLNWGSRDSKLTATHPTGHTNAVISTTADGIHNSNVSYGTVGHSTVSSRNDEILEWAGNKMDEDKKLDEMCEKFPALKKAREQFETMKRLVQE
jgi:hypothetical protein